MMQRVCAAALLHKGITHIHNPGHSNDDKAALGIIQQFGASVIYTEDKRIGIQSSGEIKTIDSIHCGESGLSARLFTPIAALSNSAIKIVAEGSLTQRPMKPLLNVLKQLQVSILQDEFPLVLQGPLQAANLNVNAAESSQYLSGLLFALSAAAHQTIEVDVSELSSKPYIDLTLQVLQHFGKPIENINYTNFIIRPERFTFTPEISIDLESDWSAASCLMVAAAIKGCIHFKHINKDSLQADKAILQVLKSANAQISYTTDGITIKHGLLNPFEFDARDCPDLFPALSILASACRGESSIRGLSRLLHKESNRAASIADMLDALGIPFFIEDDCLIVSGVEELEAAHVEGCNDHRIVMAAAVAALRAKGPVTIRGAEAINKSYPAFFKDLRILGVDCTINQI